MTYLSLPLWIAYWAIGIASCLRDPLFCRSYFCTGWKQHQLIYARHIDRTVGVLDALSSRVRPENWDDVKYYFSKTAFTRYALTSTLLRMEMYPVDLPQAFTDYATEQETTLAQTLHKVRYLIDDRNTLALVLGPWRIEKVSQPATSHHRSRIRIDRP